MMGNPIFLGRRVTPMERDQGRMVGGWHSGRAGRVVLALLALALLLLPLAPSRHAALAMPQHGMAIASPCPDHAAPIPAPEDAPARHGDPAQGLACCAAAPCAGLQGVPPPAPAAAPVLAAATPARPAPPNGLPGRNIPPDPRPPRSA